MKKRFLGAFLLLFLLSSAFAQDIEQLQKEKPFRWTGVLNASNDFYGASGDIPFRSDRYAWRISGNPMAYVYGIELPFSFTLGQQIRDVRYPTFNQFGVSPNYKWIKLHAGWRNMNFSPYTLAGHTFLGAGVELTPGKFRFAAMYGRFHRARITSAGQEYFVPTYKRTGYGVKIGFGTEANFIDLMAFKAKDEPNSIAPPDSLGLTPGENLVLGLSGRATLFQRVSFSLDGAASAYTRNLNSEPVALDSIGSGQYYGIENAIRPRFSTRFNFAGKAALGYASEGFGLQLAYERIDPEYATMGAYFFNNDIANYTVAPTFSLASGKVRLFGSYGLQRNNLLGNRSETSWRNIGSANASINPNQHFGLDLNFSNYRMTQSGTAFELNDSLKLAQVTTQYSATPRYSIFGKDVVHTFILNGVYQFLDDQNPLTEKFGDVRAKVAILTYSGAWVKNGLSFQTGINYNGVTLGEVETTNYGFLLGAGRSFGKDKMNVNLNTNFNLAQLNGERDGAVINASLSGMYRMHPKHALNFGLHFIRSTSSYRGKYSELRGMVGYSWVLQ